MPDCTNSRDPARQIWPELRKIASTAQYTALSRSASSKTRLAPLPPSSSETGARWVAAEAMIALPVTEEPVKVTRSTRSSAVSEEPAGAPCPLSTLSTPGGKPASTARRPRSVTDAGVSSLGLMMQVLPHAIAGAIFQVAIISGKFHGLIAATTPAGPNSL